MYIQNSSNHYLLLNLSLPAQMIQEAGKTLPPVHQNMYQLHIRPEDPLASCNQAQPRY